MEPLACDSGMFLLADITSLWKRVPQDFRNLKENQNLAKDWVICRWLAEEKKLLVLPASPFSRNAITKFSNCSKNENDKQEEKLFARFCFAKTDETLDAARQRLEQL